MSNRPDLATTDHDDAPPSDDGLSLDKLNQAFAEMLGGDDPYSAPVEPPLSEVEEPIAAEQPDPTHDDACPITPQTILEAMLFVGHPQNEPLSMARVAGLMRGVRASELDEAIVELNRRYDSEGRPYRIVSEGDGYRLTLRDEFAPLREQFYGKVRESRLSTAAVEVLSLVAYNESLTLEEVNKLRGTPSGPLLNQMVRRQLLSVEPVEGHARQVRYKTTQRFLDLFGLQSLDDLPRSQDLEKR